MFHSLLRNTLICLSLSYIYMSERMSEKEKEKPLKMVYGNIMAGEKKETNMHILILPAGTEYDNFLSKILKKYKVKSPHPIVAWAHGEHVIVISGEGLKCDKCKGEIIKGELKELYTKLEKARNELEAIIEDIYNYYFEVYFEDDLYDDF